MYTNGVNPYGPSDNLIKTDSDSIITSSEVVVDS